MMHLSRDGQTPDPGGERRRPPHNSARSSFHRRPGSRNESGEHDQSFGEHQWKHIARLRWGNRSFWLAYEIAQLDAATDAFQPLHRDPLRYLNRYRMVQIRNCQLTTIGPRFESQAAETGLRAVSR